MAPRVPGGPAFIPRAPNRAVGPIRGRRRPEPAPAWGGAFPQAFLPAPGAPGIGRSPFLLPQQFQPQAPDLVGGEPSFGNLAQITPLQAVQWKMEHGVPVTPEEQMLLPPPPVQPQRSFLGALGQGIAGAIPEPPSALTIGVPPEQRPEGAFALESLLPEPAVSGEALQGAMQAVLKGPTPSQQARLTLGDVTDWLKLTGAVIAYPYVGAAEGVYQAGFDYPIQILNQIGKLPQRLIYTGVVEFGPEVVSPAGVGLGGAFQGALGFLPDDFERMVQRELVDNYRITLQRRQDFEEYAFNGHSDVSKNGYELNWERIIGKPFTAEGTETIPKLMESSGITGIGWTFLLDREAEKRFYDDIKAGKSISAAVVENENWVAQMVLETATDPLNLAFLPATGIGKTAGRIGDIIFPVGRVLGEAAGEIAGIPRGIFAAREAEKGFAALAARAARAEAPGVLDPERWLIQQSKRSMFTKYGDYVGDTLHTSGLRLPDELKASPIEGFQRLILEGMEGKGPLLETLSIKQQGLVKDFVAKMSEKQLVNLPDILDKYGVFAERVATTPAGKIVITRALEGASDPGRIAEYLKAAVMHQYAIELGFSIRPKGAVGRFVNFVGGAFREAWLGPNPAYMLTNAGNNVLKTIISDYAYNPFDLPNSMKLTRYLGEYGVVLPHEVSRGWFADVTGYQTGIGGPTKVEQLPLFGTPEGQAATIDKLFGTSLSAAYKESWLNKSSSPLAKILKEANLSTAVRKGLDFSNFAESTARMNIFYQAFRSQVEGKFRPQWVTGVTADPNIPPDLASFLANPLYMKNPGDIDRWGELYLRPTKPSVNLGAYPVESIPHKTSGPEPNQIMMHMGDELERIQQRANWDFKSPEVQAAVENVFDRAEYVAKQLLNERDSLLSKLGRTPQEQNAEAFTGPPEQLEMESIMRSAAEQALPAPAQTLGQVRLTPKEQFGEARAAAGERATERLQRGLTTERGPAEFVVSAETPKQVERDFVASLANPGKALRNPMLETWVTDRMASMGYSRDQAILEALDLLDTPEGLTAILDRARRVYNEQNYPASTAAGEAPYEQTYVKQPPPPTEPGVGGGEVPVGGRGAAQRGPLEGVRVTKTGYRVSGGWSEHPREVLVSYAPNRGWEFSEAAAGTVEHVEVWTEGERSGATTVGNELTFNMPVTDPEFGRAMQRLRQAGAPEDLEVIAPSDERLQAFEDTYIRKKLIEWLAGSQRPMEGTIAGIQGAVTPKGEPYVWPSQRPAQAEVRFWGEKLSEKIPADGSSLKLLVDLEDVNLKVWPVDQFHFESAQQQASATGHAIENFVAVTRVPGKAGDVFVHGVGFGSLEMQKAQVAVHLVREYGLAPETLVIGAGVEAPLSEWLKLTPEQLLGKYAIIDREAWIGEKLPQVQPLNPKQLRTPDELSVPFQKAARGDKPLVMAAFEDGRVGWNWGDNHGGDLIRPAGYTRDQTSAWGMHIPDQGVWALGGAREGVERMVRFLETNNVPNPIVRITLEDSMTDQWLFAGKLKDYWEWANLTQTPSTGLTGGGAAWYSTLEEAIKAFPDWIRQVDPQQMKQALISRGASQDELKWTGMVDWLNGKSGPVTKQEVADWFTANQVKLEVVEKGGVESIPIDFEAVEPTVYQGEELPVYKWTSPEGTEWTAQGTPDFGLNVYLGRQFIGEAEDLAQAREVVRRELIAGGYLPSGGGEQTQYSTYTVPGGENYREFLLKLPAQQDVTEPGVSLGRLVPETYQSPHWSSDPNTVVHFRADDRIVITKQGESLKAFNTIEFQSDWGQTAQDIVKDIKRVQAGLKPAKYKVVADWPKELQDVVVTARGFNTPEVQAQVASAGWSFYTSNLPPPGPFVGQTENWVGVAVRKAIQRAAEEGYDMIAFPTADTIAVAEGWARPTAEWPQGVGVEPAGFELNKMQEGARTFYEEIVQNYVKKFARRWGVEPETVVIRGTVAPPDMKLVAGPAVDYEVPAIRITPEMRASVTEEGVPMFGAGRPPRQPGVGGGAEGQEIPQDGYPYGHKVWDDASANWSAAQRAAAQEEYDKFMAEITGWRRSARGKMKQEQRWQEQTAEQQAATRAALNKYKNQWIEHLQSASDYAAAEVERILFDYASTRNWEEVLRYYSPFTTWQLRDPLYWAQAMLQKPGLISFWNRYQELSEAERQKRGLTSRFKGTMPMPGQELLQEQGMIPPGYYGMEMPQAFLTPSLQYKPPFEPFEQAPPTPIQELAQKVFSAEQWLGIRPWPWIEALETAAGLRAPTLRGDLFGPMQQLPVVGEALDVAQEKLGLGPTQANVDLNDYYARRRLVEWVAEGRIDEYTASQAAENPQDPMYQAALAEMQQQLQGFQGVRSLLPANIKYASPGESRIRGLKTLPVEERTIGEFGQEPSYPFLDLYNRLFKTPEERKLDAKVDEINRRYAADLERLNPDTQEWYDVQQKKVEEIAAAYANRPPSELENRAVFPVNPQGGRSERLNVLYELEDQEPKPGDFLTESGDIDWDVYNLAIQQHTASIPELSRRMGISISQQEYDRFRNRYKTADELVVVLNRRQLQPGYDLREALYDANSTEFAAALQQLLSEQITGDIGTGMQEPDAQARAAATADYVKQNGLPYEFIQKMLSEYGPRAAGEFLGQISEMRPELLTGMEPAELAYTMPGLEGVQDSTEKARRALQNFYYAQLPPGRRAIQQQLKVPEGSSFTEFLERQSDADVLQLYNEWRRQKVGDVLAPQKMAPANQAKMEQVERDWFQYTQAKAAVDAANAAGTPPTGPEPVWTPLMEELYGEPNAPSGQFWDLWRGRETWQPEAYGDPFIQLVLDKAARGTATDEQYAEALKRLQSYASGAIPEGRKVSDAFWDVWWSKRNWPDVVWDNPLIARIMNKATREGVSDEDWQAAIGILHAAPVSAPSAPSTPRPTQAPQPTQVPPTSAPAIPEATPAPPAGPPPPAPPTFPPPPAPPQLPPPPAFSFLPDRLQRT